MIFWDTSALAPLLVVEGESGRCSRLAREEPGMTVWWGTSVECRSALARRVREGMSAGDAARTRDVLAALSRSWAEILPSDEVREHAGRLLDRHPLRAADALQLGAAMTWADARPRGHRFATLDARLAEAAVREGFALAL